MKTYFPNFWRPSLHIIRKNLGLIVPLAIGRFFKYFLLALIINPLIKNYQQGNSVRNLIHYLNDWGINLNLPMLYCILILLYFLSYCISTLLFNAELSSILALFHGKKFSLKLGFQKLGKRLKPLLTWCLINKTWGVFIRLRDALLRFFSMKNSYLRNTRWPIITLFSSALIIDKNQSSLEAMKNSKLIIEQHFGKNPRYSFILFKPLFVLLALSCVPLFIGFLLQSPQALWLGFLLTLGCWYCISLLESCLHLILFGAFYEYFVNGRLVAGFNEKELQHAILLKSSHH